MKPKYICIVGRKRSGKDTAANYLNKLGASTIEALASPIKDLIYDSWIINELDKVSGLEMTRGHLDGFADGGDYDRESFIAVSNSDVFDLMQYCLSLANVSISETVLKTLIMENDKPWSLRRLMQLLGTDLIGTHGNEYFWVQKLIQRTITPHTAYMTTIISDVRLQYELDIFRRLGALIIFVERDTESTDSHITEQGLLPSPGDTVIVNNGTLEEFYEQLKLVGTKYDL